MAGVFTTEIRHRLIPFLITQMSPAHYFIYRTVAAATYTFVILTGSDTRSFHVISILLVTNLSWDYTEFCR